MSAVTAWQESDGVHERRYCVPDVCAAMVYRITDDDGDRRRWRMGVWRVDNDRPHSWWRYHTLDEAIAGADSELSAIVPGLERNCACGDTLTLSESTRCARCTEGERS